MTNDELGLAFKLAEEALDRSDEPAAWAALDGLHPAWHHDSDAARCAAWMLALPGWSPEPRLERALEMLEHQAQDAELVAVFAERAEAFVDMRFLNAAPPTHTFFLRLLELTARCFEKASAEEKARWASKLGNVARVSGRGADALSDRAWAELVRLRPDDGWGHYNRGLYLKTRGRFAEGLEANQRAAHLGLADEESVVWNLGICATGAGEGRLALEHWRAKLKSTLELGSTGLPEGTWHGVKVRLAERPLAERSASQDDPGSEETVWVERLSPCHGVIQNALVAELGVDFQDTVLFDGAPVVQQLIGDREVPVFPHLVTLRRGAWSIFRFVGMLPDQHTLEQISEALPGNSMLYSHTDNVVYYCQECYSKGLTAECTHREAQPAGNRVVRGKLCVAPEVSLADVDRSLRQALPPTASFASSALARALGDDRRARQDEQLENELM